MGKPFEDESVVNPIRALSGRNAGQRLCIYIGESDRWHGKALDTALLESLRSLGMAGATVYRGAAGFGAHSHIRSASIEVLSTDLPVLVEVVDTPERIQKVLEVVSPMVREGLITLEDITIVKYTHRYLNPLPADRLVCEVMTREVIFLQPEMSVQIAWEKMIQNSLKVLPVVDDAGKVVGILTDEDLLNRAGIQQRLSLTLQMGAEEIRQGLHALGGTPQNVGEVMTSPVITVQSEDHLGRAVSVMVRGGLKRLPVIDRDERLVGMLSRLDVLRQVADGQPKVLPEELRTGAFQIVGEIMLTDIPLVNQNYDLAAVVDSFVKWNTHRLVVVDEAGMAVGMIADSDVLARVQPEHRRGILDALRRIGKPSAGEETAFDLMSKGVTVVAPETSITDAVRLMLAEGRKWLVVVRMDRKPVGLVDRQRLLRALDSR